MSSSAPSFRSCMLLERSSLLPTLLSLLIIPYHLTYQSIKPRMLWPPVRKDVAEVSKRFLLLLEHFSHLFSLLTVFTTPARVWRGQLATRRSGHSTPMGLILTASYSLPDSAGEPPRKKLRVTDDFLENLGSPLHQQLHQYLDGVVSSEIRRLAAGDVDIRKAFDRRRPEVRAS